MSGSNRFDQAAATWDEQPRRVRLARAVGDEIARQIHLSHDMNVLDFGCGTGLLTLALQPLVRSVTGADASSGMLDILRQKVQAQRLANVETILLDPEVPLSLDARFHLIVSSMALHHVANLAPLFRRFHERLEPGGRVALADLDREDGSFPRTRGTSFTADSSGASSRRSSPRQGLSASKSRQRRSRGSKIATTRSS